MAQIQKQAHSSLQQNGEPRNKPMYVWSISLWQRSQEYMTQKGCHFNKCVGTCHMKKNETRSLNYTIHQNKPKINWRLEDLNCKIPRREHMG